MRVKRDQLLVLCEAKKLPYKRIIWPQTACDDILQHIKNKHVPPASLKHISTTKSPLKSIHQQDRQCMHNITLS